MYEEETLSEQVYQRLTNEIKKGTWEIGKHLNEKRIAESLHVSRTPVRWALKRIYDAGLLDYDKNHGYRIKLITPRDVREIYAIRNALDVLAFTEAAKAMSEEEYEAIRDLVRRSREAVESDNLDDLMNLSSEFNRAVYTAAKMPRLLMFQMDLQSVLWSFRAISFEAKLSRRKLAVEEHEQLLEAMHKKELDRLPVLLQEHLNRSESYILQVLEEERGWTEE